jgi:hypothetical protein
MQSPKVRLKNQLAQKLFLRLDWKMGFVRTEALDGSTKFQRLRGLMSLKI